MTTTEKKVEQISTNQNSGKPYTDDELKLIFSLTPTKENIKTLAKVLKRSQNGIMLQYQRAMLSNSMVKEKNKVDGEIRDANMKCRRIAKEMGWINTFTIKRA